MPGWKWFTALHSQMSVFFWPTNVSSSSSLVTSGISSIWGASANCCPALPHPVNHGRMMHPTDSFNGAKSPIHVHIQALFFNIIRVSFGIVLLYELTTAINTNLVLLTSLSFHSYGYALNHSADIASKIHSIGIGRSLRPFPSAVPNVQESCASGSWSSAFTPYPSNN
jgi:hypothetical protein